MNLSLNNLNLFYGFILGDASFVNICVIGRFVLVVFFDGFSGGGDGIGGLFGGLISGGGDPSRLSASGAAGADGPNELSDEQRPSNDQCNQHHNHVQIEQLEEIRLCADVRLDIGGAVMAPDVLDPVKSRVERRHRSVLVGTTDCFGGQLVPAK
jgi:hypothetical protein